MSGANAIHGVILVGAVIVTGQAENNLELWLGLAAVVLATINMVGGFVVTDRMLEMFRQEASAPRPMRPPGPRGGRRDRPGLGGPRVPRRGRLLHPRASRACPRPKTARNGNLIGAFGAVLAVGIDLLRPAA